MQIQASRPNNIVLVTERYRYIGHSNEQLTLIDKNITTNKFNHALYLLLPLLAYPIIFCVLIIIPLVNRVNNTSSELSYPLYMASAIAIPSMGLAAGIALIVHIMCMKLNSKKKEV